VERQTSRLFKSSKLFYLDSVNHSSSPTGPNSPKPEDKLVKEPVPPELIPLFRILVKVPPKGHDPAMCPLCKKHDIRGID